MAGRGGSRRSSSRRSDLASSVDVCAISQITTLQAPNSTVLATVQLSDELLVRLVTVGAQPSVVCETQSGQVAGSLVFTGIAQLIGCMQAGNNYVATVLSKEGGFCRVHIHRI